MRAALLCLTVMLLAAAVCQAIGPGSCECLKTSNTALRISNIKSYYVQKSGLCLIEAVVFTTVKGVKICSDSQKPWVKRAMKAVDGRRTTVSSKAVPATTAFRPTWKTTAASWPPHCCLKISNARIPAKRFAYYTVYSAGLCPINAVAFWTRKGRKLCYDPDLDWVKNVMKTVGPRSSSAPAASKPKDNRRKGKKQKVKQNKHSPLVACPGREELRGLIVSQSASHGIFSPDPGRKYLGGLLSDITDQSLQAEEMRAALQCLTVMLLAAAVFQVTGPGLCECLKTSNAVLQISNIKSYYVQKSLLCLIDAVVFTTAKGVKICSDPQKPWVKRAMKAVDGRRTNVSSTAVPVTTAFWPTLNSTAASWPPHCCLKISNTRIPAKRFAYYRVYSAGLCPINAVAFWTRKGRKLCYDPDLDWVKKFMKTVGKGEAKYTTHRSPG
ncbi:uncharacterized protein LOC118798561 [Colossoma macropomum]|uniref:uncharacterized protein LOC118798561 n=1 Tax=Colossoma macropomum TaxID=42526 RepID=UPI0018646380|nr:uncharacterized protein LOC118798561 [Colossoma macropomum]